jgi:hypothetical protein
MISKARFFRKDRSLESFLRDHRRGTVAARRITLRRTDRRTTLHVKKHLPQRYIFEMR